METNELPEDHQAKENADRIYPERTKEGQQQNTAFQNGFIYGYRLGLQSCEEQLKDLKYLIAARDEKIAIDALSMKQMDEEYEKLEEQLKAKDEKLEQYKNGVDIIASNYKERVSSLTKENERLREALTYKDDIIHDMDQEVERLKSFKAQNERMRLWFEERTGLKGDVVLLSEHMAKIDTPKQ